MRLFDGSDNPQKGWVPVKILETNPETPSTRFTGSESDIFFRKQAVVRELIETEEEFCKDLTYVIDKYFKTVDNKNVPRIVRDNKDIIFANFKQIWEFHNE